MTFDEFITEWLGKKCDFDGYYGGQCVDLYRMYVKQVLNVEQSPGVGGATEIWDSASDKYYDFIENTPTGVPLKGDIVIWDRDAGGGFGHVAIFIEGNTDSFTSFDQNWPTLDKCTKTKHNYNNVIGWMHPKGTMSVMYKGYDLTNQASMKVAVDVLDEVVNQQLYIKKTDLAEFEVENLDQLRIKIGNLNETITARDAQITKDDETIRNLNQLVNEKNNIISKSQSTISTLEQQLLDTTSRANSLEEQAILVPKLKEENDYLVDQKDKWDKKEENYRKINAELQLKVDELSSTLVSRLLEAIIKKIFRHSN